MSYVMRTSTVVFVASALALFAMPQTASNAENRTQQSEQAIHTDNVPAIPAAPAVNAQPRAKERAPVKQGQAIGTNRLQPNPVVITQPNVITQPVPPNPPSTLRPPARAGQPGFQSNPIYLQNQTVLQRPLTLRDRVASRQVLRGPDIGLWFGRPVGGGLVISDVETTGPIARLGFREGDRIVSVNGQPVVSEADFMRFALTGNDNPVETVVVRDGLNQRIIMDPTVLYQQSVVPVVEPLEQFGIVLDDRFNDRVVVWRVLPGTPAFYAGFRPGDVIATLSGQPFTTRSQFEQAIAGLPAGEVALQVRRGDRPRDLVVDVPTFVRPAPHVAARPVTPGNVDTTGQFKKPAGAGVVVPDQNQLKTDQPLDPARPNLQGGPREPRANQ
jgi:S1-C subfamily serine protease